MRFEVARYGKVQRTSDATLTLTDFGWDAETALPAHK
jgi:hypothetical protein